MMARVLITLTLRAVYLSLLNMFHIVCVRKAIIYYIVGTVTFLQRGQDKKTSIGPSNCSRIFFFLSDTIYTILFRAGNMLIKKY